MSYNVNDYTDAELFNILDLQPYPTDRELEAKIIQLIRKYENIGNNSADELSHFFRDIYARFFDIEDEEENENENEEKNKEKEKEKEKEKNKEKNKDSKKKIVEPLENNDDKKKSNNVNIPANPTYTTTLNYTPGTVNPLLKETIKRVISIDSQYRNTSLYHLSTNFTVYLTETLRDVVSMSLYSYQIPYQWFTINNSYGANFFYLKGNSPGINNENHFYKVAIPPANYTGPQIIDAIDKSLKELSTTYTDTNFGNTGISFVNASTNLRSTIKIDIQKLYNETYYQLQWPITTSTITNSLTTYLGYTSNNYVPNTIFSRTNVYNPNDDDTITIDNTNNTFNIIQYNGPNEYTSDASYNAIPITITNGLTTRAQIIQQINNKLSSNPLLTNSSITAVYNDANDQYKFPYYIYYLTINFNRYMNTNKVNSKTIVKFPTETAVWTGPQSFFRFDHNYTELNTVISEKPGFKSNYIIGDGVYIFFRCINPDYRDAEIKDSTYNYSVNDYKINIAPSNINGYSLTQYISAINNGFNTATFTDTYNNEIDVSADFHLSQTSNPNNTTILIENSYFNMHFYIRKHLPQNLYSMELTGSFLNKIFGLQSPISINVNNTMTNTSNIDLSVNVFESTIDKLDRYNITSDLIYDDQHEYTGAWLAFTLNQGYRNGYTPNPIYLLTITDINPGGSTIYNNYVELQNDINAAFQNYYAANQYPLKNSSISIIPDTNDPDLLNIRLTIIIDTVLTESDYSVEFVDPNETNSWKTFLNVVTDAQNTYTISTLPNYTLTGLNPIQGNLLQIVPGLNNVIQINPIPNPIGGAYSSDGANNLSFTIPSGIYTKSQLFAQLNSLFSQNPVTTGSIISIYIDDNNNEYTKVRMNINKIFTSADYKIVFYDTVSFFRCFNNSNSGQNVTWDNTLGWIIGFRNYTEYNLTAENQSVNPNDSTKLYYLSSITGSYYISPVTQNMIVYDPNTEVTTTYSQIIQTTFTLTSDTPVNVYIYSYFLISLNDYVLNDLNDGMVHISTTDNYIQGTSYANLSTTVCNPVTSTAMITDTNNNPNYTNLTQKQIYALNQNQQAAAYDPTIPRYSTGPDIHDLFGIIPLKLSGLQYGQLITDYGGSLQAQSRTYFGPVNISKLSISLLTDKGDFVDLQGSNWAFSLIIETLYKGNQT
jgi:hypothetical protein